MTHRIEVIGDCTLHLADCRDVLAEVGEVDCIVTDPPYGIAHASNFTRGRPTHWHCKQIANDHDTTARDEALALAAAPMAAVFGTIKAPQPAGVRANLVWNKGPAAGMGDLTVPWKPNWELIHIIGTGWRGERTSGVLPEMRVRNLGDRVHPHEKPVALIQHIIGKAPDARTILDPFMGSGTTGVACVRERRRFIGVEIDPGYFDVACRRIEAEVRAPRLDLPEPVKPVQLSMMEE